jgi:cytochrome c553
MSKVATLFVMGMLAVGCSKPSKTEPAPAASAAAATAAGDPAAEAKDYFKKTCIVCHGESGEGNGPGSAALDPKPRNFTDATWQGQVKDEEIKKAILGGGLAVGKSPVMPANPQLKSKPEVVDELVKVVRSFKR